MHSPILAKSRQNGREVTLTEHSRDVARAASTMFGRVNEPTRLTGIWLRFFGLGESEVSAFAANLGVAAALHDIGKASSSFQGAIRDGAVQMLRHEHLSALILCQPPISGWLAALRSSRVDPELVTAAIVSHHLQVNDESFAKWLVESTNRSVELYLDSPEVSQILQLASEQVGAVSAPVGMTRSRWDNHAVAAARGEVAGAMARFARTLRRDEGRWRLLLAVKAALIAVDSAGSAIRRIDQSLEEWLEAAFGQPPLTDADVEEDVIDPRVEDLRLRGMWKGFHDFQDAAGTLGPRALLLSGCGTGKTLAAWRWIAAQLRRRRASRVIFLYPTRATATEGFRDYVSWSGPALGKLVHGTSRYDLDGMFANPSDPRSGADYTVAERLFALGYWQGHYFSATVDSFLALMANRYSALCLVPLLADSVVVVDEVHSFDNSMFRALERFLKFFDVPVLCMTASLPSDRIRVLRDWCHLEVFPHDPESFPDLQRQMEAPRYRVNWIAADSALGEAAKAVASGQKVLWVVNTVPRCQAVAKRLARDLGNRAPVLAYHSRFRLRDRRDRHREAIASLCRGAVGPAVLVTTQVCEMSLDLDADVLITEAADVPALIQRMGRSCREPIPSAGRVGEVYVYQPENALPYTPVDVAAGGAFARELAAGDLTSHADLAAFLGKMEVEDRFAVDGFTGFLDSGWYAMARDDHFRDDDETSTVDCVLDRDVGDYLRARAARNGEEVAFVLPAPRRFAIPQPKLGQYVREAPATHYDVRLGFLNEEVSADF